MLSPLCNVPDGTRLSDECAFGGSLSMQLTYGDVLGHLDPPLEHTPEVQQALKAGFRIILFWSPDAERFYATQKDSESDR